MVQEKRSNASRKGYYKKEKGQGEERKRRKRLKGGQSIYAN